MSKALNEVTKALRLAKGIKSTGYKANLMIDDATLQHDLSALKVSLATTTRLLGVFGCDKDTMAAIRKIQMAISVLTTLRALLVTTHSATGVASLAVRGARTLSRLADVG
jgi:hypothetical protein